MKTIDIDKNTRTIFVEDLLTELATMPPSGVDSVMLNTSVTATKVGFIARNLTSLSVPAVVFISSGSTSAPTSFNQNITGSDEVSVSAGLDTSSALAAVAVTGTTFTNGSVIDLAQLAELKSGADANVSTSEVKVVSGNTINDDPSGYVVDLIARQATDYYQYNHITATSRPRGSINSKYEAQGIKSDSLDTAQISSTFGYREDGYLDEYAARMAGLTQQHKEVHIKSELKVLKEWASSIKLITDSIGAI